MIDLVELSDDESESFEPQATNSTVSKVWYIEANFLKFLSGNENLIKNLFEAEANEDSEGIGFLDQIEGIYDEFEEAKSQLIEFCTRSEVLQQMSLTTRANKVILFFNKLMEAFFNENN